MPRHSAPQVVFWPFSKTVVYMVSGKVSNIHAQTLSSTAEFGPKCPGPVAVGSSPMPTFSHFATASLQVQENFLSLLPINGLDGVVGSIDTGLPVVLINGLTT